MIHRLHEGTHRGSTKLYELIKQHFRIAGLKEKIQQITRCVTCAQVNQGANISHQDLKRYRGNEVARFWEMDFTEIKPGKYGYKYLLTAIDTFSGWVEAWPVRQETSSIVVRKLLQEILPRFGLPLQVGTDNGQAFTVQVTQ